MSGMKGKLALCSRGCLGRITEDLQQQVTYSDQSTGLAFVGIHLQNNPEKNVKAGDAWSSREPQIVGELSEEAIALLAAKQNSYQTFAEAIALVRDAREFQAKAWPNTEKQNAGGRPFEEWVVLLHHYMTKLDEVYTTTPGNIPDPKAVVDDACGGPRYIPNIEGRKRVRKYAAIVANLAVWAVQSALGSAYSD
jgi:hypothetical protein